MRKILKTCFPFRSCFTLSKPVDSDQKLKELDSIEWDELDEKFKKVRKSYRNI